MLLSSAGGLILDFAVARLTLLKMIFFQRIFHLCLFLLHPFQGDSEKTQKEEIYREFLRWRGIAVFQPVMNGVGGNLVAVQVDFTIIGIEEESNDDVYDDDVYDDDGDDDDGDEDDALENGFRILV